MLFAPLYQSQVSVEIDVLTDELLSLLLDMRTQLRGVSANSVMLDWDHRALETWPWPELCVKELSVSELAKLPRVSKVSCETLYMDNAAMDVKVRARACSVHEHAAYIQTCVLRTHASGTYTRDMVPQPSHMIHVCVCVPLVVDGLPAIATQASTHQVDPPIPCYLSVHTTRSEHLGHPTTQANAAQSHTSRRGPHCTDDPACRWLEDDHRGHTGPAAVASLALCA